MVEIQVGDCFLLSAEKFSNPTERNRPSKKLAARYLGPFEVLARVGPNAFKLKLPADMKCHNVINVEHLKRYVGENEENPKQSKKIKEILADKWERGKHVYLVQRHGDPREAAKWISNDKAKEECQKLWAEYNKQKREEFERDREKRRRKRLEDEGLDEEEIQEEIRDSNENQSRTTDRERGNNVRSDRDDLWRPYKQRGERQTFHK